MTKQDEEFNNAAQAYIQMFGGSLPIGVGYDELTTDALLKAVMDKRAIKEVTPDQAIS